MRDVMEWWVTDRDDLANLVAGSATDRIAERRLAHGTYRARSSFTISRPIAMAPGAMIRPASGVTVTIDAPFAAGLHQCFDLSAGGSVAFTTVPPAVYPQWWGAACDGVTDDIAAFQGAYAALPTTGGRIVVPPGTYRISGSGATLLAPKIAVNNTAKDDVWIVGWGATIVMSDYTRAYSDTLADPNGDDVFTAFAFDGVTGGGVLGFHFEGEADGVALTNGQARAKGVGITDCTDVKVSHISGVDVVGNVLNARGYSLCRGIIASHIYAEGCSESGVNYMGGTYDCTLSDLVSRNNSFHGFESGTIRLTATNLVCTGNKDGVTHVGTDSTFSNLVLEGNTFYGFDFQYNNATVSGSRNTIKGGRIRGNGSGGINASGSSAHNTVDIDIDGNTGDGVKLNSGATGYRFVGGFNGDSGTLVTGVASSDTFTLTAHGLIDTNQVKFTALTGGTGLAVNTLYYVVTAAANTFQLSLSSGGAAVNFTTDVTAGTLVRQNRSFNAVSPQKLRIMGVTMYGNTTSSVVVQTGGDDIIVTGCPVDRAMSLTALATNYTVRDNPGYLTGSATYDPASLADGAGATTTVTVAGALAGDYAAASFSNDLQGVTLTAWVSAADTVSVRFQNESGGVLDLASGTLRAKVTRG